jgi:hypothetical protein
MRIEIEHKTAKASMSDLAERLREHLAKDHDRSCFGRPFRCECGYDRATDSLLDEAATALETHGQREKHEN